MDPLRQLAQLVDPDRELEIGLLDARAV